MYESIKALDNKTSIVFDLVFASNTILWSFFLFFLITDKYFLIFEVIPQIFNSAAQIVLPIGMPTKAKIETHSAN